MDLANLVFRASGEPRIRDADRLLPSFTYIVFVQASVDALPVGYDRRRVGLNHLAFHAASREEVNEATAALRKRGVRILYEDRHPYAGGSDHYGLFFEDPDGIKVELLAE